MSIGLIFLVLLVFTALVAIHEFGHFIVAKFFKVRVDEFAIGFPPRLVSKKFGETEYSVNLLPIGGYVKIHGENPGEEAEKDKSQSLLYKPKYQQAAVMVAGPIFNILFAWVLLSAAITIGLPASAEYFKEGTALSNSRVLVLDVQKGSSAEEAGIQRGDQILFVQSGPDAIQLLSVGKIQEFINAHEGRKVTFLLEREGATRMATTTPARTATVDRAIIGISLDEIGILKLPFPESLLESVEATGAMTVGVTKGLFGFFKGIVTQTADFSSVAGPVGIVTLVGDASRFGIAYFLGFTALISVNLAVINLIPFPALDGGRLFFVGVEAITRKKIKPVVVNVLNLAGFAALILLLVFVTYHDILRFTAG